MGSGRREEDKTNRLRLKLDARRLLVRLLAENGHNNLPRRLVMVDAALNELLLRRLDLLGSDEEVTTGSATLDVDCDRQKASGGRREAIREEGGETRGGRRDVRKSSKSRHRRLQHE